MTEKIAEIYTKDPEAAAHACSNARLAAINFGGMRGDKIPATTYNADTGTIKIVGQPAKLVELMQVAAWATVMTLAQPKLFGKDPSQTGGK